MLFQTTEEAVGSTKVVVWPAPILKLCQLIRALPEVVMVSVAPEVLNVAPPTATVPPAGLAMAGCSQSRHPHKAEDSTSNRLIKPFKPFTTFDIIEIRIQLQVQPSQDLLNFNTFKTGMNNF
jgi:hypothetical protein